MNGLTAEVGYVSLIKKGEELCGDRVETVRFEDSTTLVLADGLGSGVKANILSTLTSKIIATMMASGMPVEECVRTVTRTLPICKVRKVAYSTFTFYRPTRRAMPILWNPKTPRLCFCGAARARICLYMSIPSPER